MGKNKIISGMFVKMKEECSTVNGIPSFIFLLKRLGTDALASQAAAKGHPHNHISKQKGGEIR